MADNLNAKVVNQLEYYFGDYNICKDKFLKERIAENEEGWVTIEVLLTFKRLSNLSNDAEAIKIAVKESESKILQLNDDGTKIRRNPELSVPEFNEEKKLELMTRTAYAKGFPLDTSLDDIIAFLKDYGPVDSCYKRTYLDRASKDHKFKGSCFITFNTLDLCTKFVEAENVKFNDTDLLRKFQKAYFEGKKEEYAARKNQKKKKKEDDKAEAAPVITFPKGTIFHFTGIEEGQLITREEIKSKIEEIVEIKTAFIDYTKTNKEGHVRMSEENGAKTLVDKLTDGELEIGDIKLKCRVIENEEEEAYFQKTREFMTKRRQQTKGKKRRGNFEDRKYKRSRN